MAYNLDGVDELVVNADVLAKIFSGADHQVERSGHRRAQQRRDPARHQNHADLPVGFVGHHRQLPEVSGRRRPADAGPRERASEFQGGAGEGAQKSAGVVQAVQATPGAIGYVEKGFADQAGLPFAQIDNGGGAVALTDDAAGKAIDAAKFKADGND